MKNRSVIDYIHERWNATVRVNVKDEGNLIGLPYPYTVPSMKDAFNEMYYWDTYFTNKGLIAGGRVEQAKHNCNNIAYLIQRYGYMPNGNRTPFLGRSQPPLFGLMLRDVYACARDKEWLREVYEALKIELKFWNTRRMGEQLNAYSLDNDESFCANFFRSVSRRIRVDETRDPIYAGRCYGAEAESGWDFSPRFAGACAEYESVDLNSFLYAAELIASYFAEELDERKESAFYAAAASSRANAIGERLYDVTRGVYADYNFKTKRFSPVLSCASFAPYFVGLASKERKEGLLTLLEKLELPYGVSAAEATEESYQWGHPNAWAPLQLMATVALENYGYKEHALRVAKKYVELIERNFEKTGGLWEKYNAETGGIDAVSEYGTPQMMGWTAGTYLFFKERYQEL